MSFCFGSRNLHIAESEIFKTMTTTGTKPASSSGQCTLENAAINLSALREHAKKELVDLISSVRLFIM